MRRLPPIPTLVTLGFAGAWLAAAGCRRTVDLGDPADTEVTTIRTDSSDDDYDSICELDADQSRVVDGVLRTVAGTLFGTLSHRGEVRPTVELFPGGSRTSTAIRSLEYENCQPASRTCRQQSFGCFDGRCRRCSAVECRTGSGSWTVRVWATESGESPGRPLTYTTSQWRVEYTSSPVVAWRLGLTFPSDLTAETEISHELTVTSRRSGETYAASYGVDLRGHKEDGASEPDRFRMELTIPGLHPDGTLAADIEPDGAGRPSGILRLENKEQARFRRLESFTIVSNGDRVNWAGSCESF